jgi:hypothetical protein
VTDLCYILAASHSGSTLLAMLLGAHPDVCTVGELKATSLGDVELYRCSCGSRIRECGFWARVSERMAARGVPFDIANAGTNFGSVRSGLATRLLRPLHRGPLLEAVRDVGLMLSPAWRTQVPVIQRTNLLLMETICELSGARVMVDSSKIGLRLKYLLRNPELNVRVIRLVRDGRAVVTTYMNPAEYADAANPALRGGGMGGDRASERLSIAQAAWEWRRSNEEAEFILAGMDRPKWTEVRYEDLCLNTSETLARLFGFLNVKPAGSEHGFRGVDHHVLGNGMRLDTTTAVRLDERWRSVLTPEDVQAFDSVAGAMSRRYGYA